MKRALLLASVLALAAAPVFADDILVNWTNATAYDDASPMPPTDIASSTAWCGLSLATLTLKTTVNGPAQQAVVRNAQPGTSYVCAVAHTSVNGAASVLSQPSAPVTIPAPSPKRPSAPTSVTVQPAPK